jgi:hypothetical protein
MGWKLKNEKSKVVFFFWGRCGLGISLDEEAPHRQLFFYFYFLKNPVIFVLMLYYSLPHVCISLCFYFFFLNLNAIQNEYLTNKWK